MPAFAHQKNFVTHLLKWNASNNTREMPWKGEKDPYKIWLSEIILQQTRVDQGLDYYHRFVAAFPTIHELAIAPETKVFKLWEGLGYYSRCKNLLATARYINEELQAKFPDNYEAILSLKGIGPYTAAAISSFAFNLPFAVVDGNVYRVLARYFGIFTPTDSTEGKKLFSVLANDLLDKRYPGIYNQALMDFGATICKPKSPLCSSCVFSNRCVAFTTGSIPLLPVKEKSIVKRTRWFYYLVIECDGMVYVRKRGAKDIWENLYEFILVETSETKVIDHFQLATQILGKNKFDIEHISAFYKQVLTHQTIQGQFINIKIGKPVVLKGYTIVEKKSLPDLPFPKFINHYLKDKNVSLNLF